MRTTRWVETTFAGYEIEEQLGRGGMSEVYRARNPRLGNVVALKLLAPELNEDELFRERFVRESQIAASLDHPNVIPIHDAGEHAGVPYIAMRYVDGPNLGELIKRGELPLEHVVSIVGQVASALDAAHERGLIHRDVKPANVLIDRYTGLDSAPHIYLSDFGVAKHTLSRSGLTTTGQFVGTIDYVAPEQIEGKGVDAKTDVYSLGCVFYECLVGKRPFERESNVAVMYAHLLEPPPAPSEKREGLPEGFDAVVATAMAKAPEERYTTCGELASAARSAAAGLAPSTPTVISSSKSTIVPASKSTVTSGTKPTVPSDPEPSAANRPDTPYIEIDSGTAEVAKPLPAPAAQPPTAETLVARPWRRVARPKVLLAGLGALLLLAAGFGAVQVLAGGSKDAVGDGPNRTTVNAPPPPPPPPVTTSRVRVPALGGATQKRAVRWLRNHGLRATVVRLHSSARKGLVIAQKPRKGTRLRKGRFVALTISSGPVPPKVHPPIIETGPIYSPPAPPPPVPPPVAPPPPPVTTIEQ
jgi:serine/threonine protein kinase